MNANNLLKANIMQLLSLVDLAQNPSQATNSKLIFSNIEKELDGLILAELPDEALNFLTENFERLSGEPRQIAATRGTVEELAEKAKKLPASEILAVKPASEILNAEPTNPQIENTKKIINALQTQLDEFKRAGFSKQRQDEIAAKLAAQEKNLEELKRALSNPTQPQITQIQTQAAPTKELAAPVLSEDKQLAEQTPEKQTGANLAETDEPKTGNFAEDKLDAQKKLAAICEVSAKEAVVELSKFKGKAAAKKDYKNKLLAEFLAQFEISEELDSAAQIIAQRLGLENAPIDNAEANLTFIWEYYFDAPQTEQPLAEIQPTVQ